MHQLIQWLHEQDLENVRDFASYLAKKISVDKIVGGRNTSNLYN